ncbi:MAG: fibronectin type III domain-containing protein [Anaerolineales bacterium]
MSRIKWAVVLLLLVAALAACDRPAADSCTPEDLVAPEQTYPPNYSIIGTSSVQPNTIQPDLLQWTFSPDCVPDHFKVLFSPDHDFGIARSGMTNGETTWPLASFEYPQLGLEPATEYFWTVRGWTDGVNGPESSTHVFFTGPQCASAAEADPPELLEPAPGEIIEENYATLHYIAGGASPCLPDGYFVDLQTDSSFSGTTLLGEYEIPGTFLMTEELDDCTTYYWRVAPIIDGVQGPFSDTRAFTVAIDPTCMPYSFQMPEIPYLDLELCGPEDLSAPELVSPPQFSVLGNTPGASTVPIPDEFFQWSYTGCQPELFKVIFSWEPDFGIARMGETDGELSWPRPDAEWPQIPIEAGTEYWWYVYGWADGVLGPPSEMRIFFTGPTCGAAEVVPAPVILEPTEGEAIPSTTVTLHWEPGEPKCVPQMGYFIDIQTESDFSGTNILPDPWFPKHTLATIDGLEDCTTYYVRMAATLNAQGDLGPYSETRSFFTNESGTCMQSLVPEISAVRDLACYEGPNPELYPIQGYLLAGETAVIVAQNLDQTWWYIENPDAPNNCAIPKDGGETMGDISQIPMWNDPDLGVPCSSYTTENACLAAECRWVPQATRAGGGYCTDP